MLHDHFDFPAQVIQRVYGENGIVGSRGTGLRVFPDFPAYDRGRIRDIQYYTWEQITFFMERYVEVPQQGGDQPIAEVPRASVL